MIELTFKRATKDILLTVKHIRDTNREELNREQKQERTQVHETSYIHIISIDVV